MTVKYILLFLVFSSCANFINRIDDDLLTQKSIPYKKVIDLKTYCKEVDPISLMSENLRSQKVFKNFIANHQLTFVEKTVLWTFVQMILRPDLASPGAKFQLFFKKNGKRNYYHFYSKTDKKSNRYPLLYGLDYLLTKFGSKKSLIQMAKIFDQIYPNQFFVSEDFANFLEKNQQAIINDPILRQYYTRADDPLRKNERIPKQKLTPFVLKYLKTKNEKNAYAVNDYLFNYKRNSLINTECNYDMSLYSSSIYLIQDKSIQSNLFGIRETNDAALLSTTQEFEKLSSHERSIFFNTQNTPTAPAMCQFTSKTDDIDDIWLVSTDSRDPGQHLFHLIEYGLQNIDNIDQLDTMVKFSRHLFLKNPVRLILESERSSEEQLTELLKLNMPIYNSAKLGKVWSYLKDKKSHHFLIDDRRSGAVSCMLGK